MKIYHWSGAHNKNFGDILGPYLVKKLTEHNVEWAKPENSDAVIIGSIMEHLPQQYKGTVAGIGIASSNTKKDLTQAKVLAVRGKFTLNNIQTVDKNIILGDPGLLAPIAYNVDNVSKEYKYGMILHYNDKQNQPKENYNVIDIKSGIENIITEAAKCEKIITSSLHGLILADSLFLPRKWLSFNKIQRKGLKFSDYASSIDMPIYKNTWQTADTKIIKQKQQQLLEMLECL
jgi:pyruvyltransferase